MDFLRSNKGHIVIITLIHSFTFIINLLKNFKIEFVYKFNLNLNENKLEE